MLKTNSSPRLQVYPPIDYHVVICHVFVVKKMRTGKAGTDGVQGAFDTLFKPNDHIKIIIEPRRTGALKRVTN